MNFNYGTNDRPVLQNVEVEEAILGGIMLDPEAMGRVSDNLVSEAFSLEAHKLIYQAALSLKVQNKPTDLMTVAVWLSDRKQLEKIGGENKLAQLVDRTVSAVNIDQYALLVTEKYLRRRLIKAGHEIVELGYQTDCEIPEVLEQAERKVFAFNEERYASTQDVERIDSILIRNIDEMEGHYSGLSSAGYATGLKELDAILGGLSRQELVVLGGRPSTGKSSLGFWIAYSIAHLYKKPTVIFSLEMSKEQLTYRLLSPIARIEYERLKVGRLSIQEWEALSYALGEISNLPIYIDDSSTPSLLQIKSKLRRVISHEGSNSLGLVVIDYLQLMGEGNNPVNELDAISKGLKAIAKDFDVPVLVLSQLHRGVESRPEKRPMMSDLRSSGGIEQNADVIGLLYRDDYYNADSQEKGIIELNIAKNRNGRIGTIKLLFEKEFNRFLDLKF